MKSSTIKTVVVECQLKNSLDTKEFEVDSDIFDDIYLEAATRFTEQHVKKANAKIPMVIFAFEKKDIKNFSKYFGYNSYFLIINAGFHKKAEVMRKNFFLVSGVDLQKESIKDKNGKSEPKSK